jgi:hypothetical protein
VRYADDILLIMPGDARQLLVLKGLLRSFAHSTGLQVNFDKSFLVPINMDEGNTAHLAQTLGCAVGTMTFTYLGLPLGTTKPTVNEYIPILTRIEKRLMGLNKLLSYYGRLLMCALKIPVEILEKIGKYKKHCLWDGGDINRKGTCLVAWDKDCRPKGQGSLGIINLRTHNTALLLKYLHKFYNHHDLPWVHLT